jgi:hypothetical protein
MLEEEGANVLGRDSDEYKTNYYRAHWQPACAITGLVGCTLVVLFSGWPAIYLLKQRNTMSTASNLKNTLDLIGDIIGAYSGVRPNIHLLNDTPAPWLTARSPAGIISYSILAIQVRKRDGLSKVERSRACVSCA